MPWLSGRHLCKHCFRTLILTHFRLWLDCSHFLFAIPGRYKDLIKIQYLRRPWLAQKTLWPRPSSTDEIKRYFYGLDGRVHQEGVPEPPRVNAGERPSHVDSKWEPPGFLRSPSVNRLIERWSAPITLLRQRMPSGLLHVLEFLMGRTMANSLVNLGFIDDGGECEHELG